MILLALLVIILLALGLIFFERVVEYLASHDEKRMFRPWRCVTKFITRTKEPFTAEDRILLWGAANVFTIIALILIPKPDLPDPVAVFYGSTLDIGQAALAVFEAEDFYSNIAEVVHQTIFEAEDEGVGHERDNIGKIVIDYAASNQRARFARPSLYRSGGILGETTVGANFGPGGYAAEFNLRTSDITYGGIVARLQAYNPHTNTVMHERVLYYDDFTEPNVYETFVLDFDVDRVQSVVLRVEYEADTKGELWYDNVAIEPDDDQRIVYERDSYFTVVDDELASGGQARRALISDPTGHMLFGVNTKQLTFGNYDAIFRLKVADNTSNRVVARIEVVDNEDASDLFVSKEIRASDFKQANEYQNFTLPFVQKSRREMDFRVFIVPTIEVHVDAVQIVQR